MADEQNTQTAQEQSAESTRETAGADSTAKTFTQEEVNALITARLERDRKGQPSKEELTAFRDWQNSQKTAEQKSADDLKAAQEAQSAAEQKATDLEAVFAAIKAGVPAEAAEDVVALAKLKVTDDMPLAEAIAAVLKKYPQFAGNSAQTTGVPTGSGSTALFYQSFQ